MQIGLWQVNPTGQVLLGDFVLLKDAIKTLEEKKRHWGIEETGQAGGRW